MKKISISLIIFAFAISALISCAKESASQNKASQAKMATENLLKLLTRPGISWHVEYFPMLDSSLYSNKEQNIKTSEEAFQPLNLAHTLGVGGYNLFVKFNDKGLADIISDIPDMPVEGDLETYKTVKYSPQIQKAEYALEVSDGLCLFFKTNTVLEKLFNLNINISTRFTPVKADTSEIILRSYNYIAPHKEYIRLKAMRLPESKWVETMQKYVQKKENFINRLYKDYTHTRIADGHCVLQILNSADNAVFYQTTESFASLMMPYRIAAAGDYDPNTYRALSRFDRTQYALFIKNEFKSKGTFSSVYTALGSGWIATENGIKFLPGIRYNNDLIFRNFEEKGYRTWESHDIDGFIARIVFIKNN